MSDERRKRHVLLHLAAEGVIPVVGGCAGALMGGPGGGLAGILVGQVVEKGINLFGKGIVDRWRAWFAHQPAAERAAAVAELAATPPAEAREQASVLLAELAPDADAQDLAVAVEYLASLPRSIGRALLVDPDAPGGVSLPSTVSLDDAHSLLRLLPEDVPPYAVGAQLAGTPYRLDDLLGVGGFGAVYRASSPSLQHLPLAIKFCLDRSLLPGLNLERSNLERLMRAGADRGAAHVVRLYGYDLDHATPYLVYEYVPGGDLTAHLAGRLRALGRKPDAAEVLAWVTQAAEGLAFAHKNKLVHRDLKPANVLVHDGLLKLADFGLGGLAIQRAVRQSRIGITTIDYLSVAEQASLFRGAGTPLYMSPEQRRGANPNPRHDLYSLGVMWFQLLVGDVTRELHPGWAKELRVRFGVPAAHVDLIDRCVGWLDERPKDAGELLPLLQEAGGAPVIVPEPRPAPVLIPSAETVPTQTAITPSDFPEEEVRKEHLLNRLKRVAEAERGLRAGDWIRAAQSVVAAAGGGVLIALLVGPVLYEAMLPTPNTGRASEGTGNIRTTATLWAILAGAVAAVPNFLLVRRRFDRLARARLDAAVRRAADEFPVEMEVWGGPDRLKDRVFLTIALRQVEQPTFRVSARTIPPPKPAPISAPPPGTSLGVLPETLLRARVRRLVSRHAAVERAENLSLIPWAIGSVFAAVVVGWLTTVILFHSSSYERNIRFDRFDQWSVVWGCVVGVAFAPIGVLIGRRWRTAQRREAQRRLAVEIAEATADPIVPVAAWGGPAVLASPDVVRRISRFLDRGFDPANLPPPVTPADVQHGPGAQRALEDRLRALLTGRNNADIRLAATVLLLVAVVGLAVVAGILAVQNLSPHFDPQAAGFFLQMFVPVVAGAFVGMLMVWAAYHAMMHAWRWRIRRRAELMEDLERDYAPVIRSWGGVTTLADTVGVYRAIERLR